MISQSCRTSGSPTNKYRVIPLHVSLKYTLSISRSQNGLVSINTVVCLAFNRVWLFISYWLTTCLHSSSVPCLSLLLRPLFRFPSSSVFTFHCIRTALLIVIIPFNQCAHLGTYVYIYTRIIHVHIIRMISHTTDVLLFYCRVPV